jgi:predicted transcriptional regulator
MPGWLWGLVAIYVIGRSAGKMGGAWLGARWTGSDRVVRRYLGMGLFAQGGVAIGLSIMAGQHLGNIHVTDNLTLGDTIIFGVAATTLIVQLLGPPMVKLAVKLSGEGGRNITREDIIAELKAQDVMDDSGEYILEGETLAHVVQRFTQGDPLYYPVVNTQGHLIGGLSLNMLKDVLADQATWSWLVASDVMRSVAHQVYPSTALKEVLAEMDHLRLQYLPVVQEDDQDRPIGVIALSHVQHHINREILKRRQTG